MKSAMISEILRNPELYGPKVKAVNILQTHISFIVLTGKYAYKVKKPVNFGFLDFSTLEKRKYFCEEELRLNKRLCPDIYLEVLPITQKNKIYELRGKGKIIEYILKMKEFPQENIMTNLLRRGKITEGIIDKICNILVDFYNAGKHSKEIDGYGDWASIKKNIDENFEQTQSVVDVTIPKGSYNFIKETTDNFFKKNKDLFNRRIVEGFIHDCHGDLHSGNIVITDNIYIFDCIEFNKRFRYCDVGSDIGFLAMDLDYQNYSHLSSYLIQKYIEKSGDVGILDVLNFYKSYRAYVRGKVIGFQLEDPNIEKTQQRHIIDIARKYYDLSYYYAQLCLLSFKKKRPLLLVVCGLTGTGKSTIALKLAIDYHATQINTDIVRKELAGINKYERHHDTINTGLYSPKKVDTTYTKVFEKVAELLKEGKNIVVDATFQKMKYRKNIVTLAKQYNAMLYLIECICPDDIVKQRLDERVKKKSISDGRWEIYLNQKTTYEPFSLDERVIEFDTSKSFYEQRMTLYQNLISRILEDIK